MTEQDAVASQPKDKIEPAPVVAETDWFLQALVRLANNAELEIGITLQVSGMLVSGTLISGKKYFEESGNQFSESFKDNADISDAFQRLFSAYKDFYNVPPEQDSNLPPPNYIHLRNAKFYQPGQHGGFPIKQGILWRGRIAEVGGLILGSFSED